MGLCVKMIWFSSRNQSTLYNGYLAASFNFTQGTMESAVLPPSKQPPELSNVLPISSVHFHKVKGGSL
jgi:hypothetical protein